jgi:predicted ArsR family transcriptional regulator
VVDLREHPLRTALLSLLRQRPTLTSTEAARELGGSSGLHSFHLRQLARAGLIEAVPGVSGRARPWRLVSAGAVRSEGTTPAPVAAADEKRPEPVLSQFTALNRELEDDSFRHWLAVRNSMPRRWRQDEAFSQVLLMTPEELSAMAALIRAAMQPYLSREGRSDLTGVEPVALVVRLFPLLDPPTPSEHT